MVVCRYFQQGTCKFGQSCRFEHIAPQYGSATVSPLLRQNTQPAPNVTAPKASQVNPFRTSRKEQATVRDVFNLMQQDLNEAEKGSVWPLSCYNFWPAIASGNVPGLEDISPEEMRHLQLEAQKANNMDVCNQQIQQLYQQARATINGLKVASQGTVAIIESMVVNRAQATTSQSSFANGNSVVQDAWPTAPRPVQNSIFGGSSTTNQTYGSNAASAFGASVAGQTSVFGGASQPSIFGGASASSAQTSVFGGTSQPNQQASFFAGNTAFGSPAPAPIFGAASQPTFGGNSQQSPLFAGAGAGTQQATGSIFGGAASVVSPTASQGTGSIFGGASSAAATAASSFSFALGNKFGAAANSGQIATAPSFGASAGNTANVFGGASNVHSAQPGGSIFGGIAPSQSNPQNISSSASFVPLDSTLYSSIAQLTDIEKKEFEAGTFTIGCIPTRPPPRELC